MYLVDLELSVDETTSVRVVTGAVEDRVTTTVLAGFEVLGTMLLEELGLAEELIVTDEVTVIGQTVVVRAMVEMTTEVEYPGQSGTWEAQLVTVNSLVV
jgi:hypothetical protein